jgi:class 3 adenylate cyclase/tetratricopeptide (TPR) repeat protein
MVPAGGAGPAAAASPVAERRLISVLFNDLVGFTTFSEGRDAEDVRETLSRYFELATDIIGRYGGTVEKFIGDAVMAVWGAPVAHEDDAERAVRAALDLVAAVPTLGPGIEARAGVLTGEAAVTIGAANQGMVAGDMVNTAARLQSAAPPGSVLVGEATHRAASKAIAFEEAGEQVLKGKVAPVRAWRALRVVAQRGGRNRVESLEAPFVGRQDELRLLKDLFHTTAREERTRLVSVTGPAGIGKSRLAHEFLLYLDGLIETVWWHNGRCPAYGDGISFWALGEMVRGRVGLLETDDEATTRAKVSQTVAQHVSDPDERRWIESALLALLGIESGADAAQLFGAWRTFFERLAASQPVVMIFEDLHFADSGLLDFIDHLIDWSRGVPIYVVTLARPELQDRRPTWGIGQRSFISMVLEPLTETEMRELLGGLVPGLPTETVTAIVERAEGIPLYAVEIVRVLVGETRIIQEGGVYRPTGDLTRLAVPETLTALVASRIDALDADDRALISDAAVLGQSFTLSALAAVAGSTETQLEPRIRGLVRREFVTMVADPRSPERGQYAFVQSLIREVAYNTLARADRKVRHLAAARHFESIVSDELAGALAGHYVAAYQNAHEGVEANALSGQARLALKGAAERAAALGAWDQAVGYYGRAIEVTTDRAEAADLQERMAKALIVLVRYDEAIAAIRRAAELYTAIGDRPGAAIAVAWLATWQVTSANPDAALATLEEAWSEFSDLEETEAGARLMVTFAAAFSGKNDSDACLQWADRALAVGERLDIPEVVVRGLHQKSSALVVLGRTIEGMLLLRGAGELARAHGLLDSESRWRTLSTFFAQWDDPRDGLEVARAGQVQAERMGSRYLGMQMVGNGVQCAFRTGEWNWAVELLDEWAEADDVSIGSRIEFATDRAIFSALRGRDEGPDIAKAGSLLAEVSDPQFISYRHQAMAWAALAEGRLDDAQRNARDAFETTSYFAAMTLPIAARAAIWAAEPAAARDALDQVIADRARGAALSADILTIKAGIAALEARTSEAIASYREALRAWQGLGLAWDEALCAIDMATVLDSADPEIVLAVERARSILTGLGATPILERLNAVAARSNHDAEPAGYQSAAAPVR